MQGGPRVDNLAIDAKALRTCIDVLQKCRVRATACTRKHAEGPDPFGCHSDAHCAL